MLSYRFGEIQAAHSALKGAEANDLQRRQAHRVPHSHMGLQGLRGKATGQTGQRQGERAEKQLLPELPSAEQKAG